jgi:hypothetical protein
VVEVTPAHLSKKKLFLFFIGSVFYTAEKGHGIIAYQWKCFHVSRGHFHCMEGAQKFHASMEIITSIQVVISIFFDTIIF